MYRERDREARLRAVGPPTEARPGKPLDTWQLRKVGTHCLKINQLRRNVACSIRTCLASNPLVEYVRLNLSAPA